MKPRFPVIIALVLIVFSSSLYAAEEGVMFRGRLFKWVNPFPDDAEIPTGVYHETFLSPSMQQEVGYSIYLPPQYEQNPNQRFPVVYYLHGGRPGSESRSLYIPPFLHAAMSSAETEPVIYVFVNGGILSHYNYAPFESMGEDLFVKELIPYVDAHYRTIVDRAGRGIQGFSQGGRGATRIGLKFPELFSSIAAGGGAYSVEKQIAENGGVEHDTRQQDSQRYDFGAGNDAYSLARAYAENNGPELEIALWGGTEGFNYDSIIEYMQFLDSIDISYTSYFVGGVGHFGTQLYQVIGDELMNFHADAFDIPQ